MVVEFFTELKCVSLYERDGNLPIYSIVSALALWTAVG